MQKTTALKGRGKSKATTVLLFAYGLAVGTATPLILTRCTSSGCGSCAGLCTLSLSVLPLLLFMALTGQLKCVWRRLITAVKSHRRAEEERHA